MFVFFVLFFRLTWTPLMSVIWTVSFSFRRSMSASPKHRYAEAKACTLLIVAYTHTHLNCAWTVPAFFGGVNLSCFNCRWPRRVPYYFVLLQISLPIMTALWSKTSFLFFSKRLVCWTVAFNLWQQAAIRLCSFCLKLTSTLFCVHTSAPTITWSSSEIMRLWWTLWITEVFTCGHKPCTFAVPAVT